MAHEVLLGIDRLLASQVDLPKARAVGLVTNQAALTSEWQITADAIKVLLGKHLALILTPEHGWSAFEPDATPVNDKMEPNLGVPIYSLYGPRFRPDLQLLEDLDTIIVDLQDVGVRRYTYAVTLAFLLERVSNTGIKVIICDRPNPLGGIVQGPCLDPRFRSFLGYLEVPLQHGLTLGELGLWYSRSILKGSVDIRVIPVLGWQRDQGWSGPWIPPSPGLPTLQSVLLYPGLVMLEGTNVSEGRGTSLPFQIVGAPWIDGPTLARRMNKLSQESIRFRPVSFTPNKSKYAGHRCEGVQLHVIERHRVNSLNIIIALLKELHDTYSQFAWSNAEVLFPKPSEDSEHSEPKGGYLLDYLAGTDKLRLIVQGYTKHEIAEAKWIADAGAFIQQMRSLLLYNPAPTPFKAWL